MPLTKDDVSTLSAGRGTVVGPDGDKIGDVGQLYTSDTTGEPTWVTVKTGLFGTQESFVPLTGARMNGDDVQVAYDKATVKDAPRVDQDGHLSEDEEDELHRYYESRGRGSDRGDRRDDDRRDLGDRRDDAYDRDRDRDTDQTMTAGPGLAAAAGTGAAVSAAGGGDPDDRRERDYTDRRDDTYERRDDDTYLRRRDDNTSRTGATDVAAGGTGARAQAAGEGQEDITPGTTRTRMQRYVVTEEVVRTVEAVPDDDDR